MSINTGYIVTVYKKTGASTSKIIDTISKDLPTRFAEGIAFDPEDAATLNDFAKEKELQIEVLVDRDIEWVKGQLERLAMQSGRFEILAIKQR